MTKEARAAAERRGRRAESFALAAYRLRGFSVVARRYKAAGGEIDLALLRGRLLVIAEVKARAQTDNAIAAVTPQARRRIEAATRSLQSKIPRLAECDLRYDIVAVAGWRVNIIVDAWREGLA